MTEILQFWCYLRFCCDMFSIRPKLWITHLWEISSRDWTDRKWSSLPPLDSLARTGHRLVFLCSSVSKVRDWNIGILSKLREIPEPESLLKVSWAYCERFHMLPSCYPPKMRPFGKDQRFSGETFVWSSHIGFTDKSKCSGVIPQRPTLASHLTLVQVMMKISIFTAGHLVQMWLERWKW